MSASQFLAAVAGSFIGAALVGACVGHVSLAIVATIAGLVFLGLSWAVYQ